MDRFKRAGEKLEEKDILGRRGAAAAVMLLIGGPIIFLTWFRLAASGAPFGWTWHAPAIATAVCTFLGFCMPEKMVDLTGRLIFLPFVE